MTRLLTISFKDDEDELYKTIKSMDDISGFIKQACKEKLEYEKTKTEFDKRIEKGLLPKCEDCGTWLLHDPGADDWYCPDCLDKEI